MGFRTQLHGQHHIVRSCFFRNGRKRPAQILPSAHNLIHTAAGFLCTSEHHEHLLQDRVAANAAPSLEVLLPGDQHHPLVHKDKALVGALHDDMPLCIDVLVDDAVDKCLPHGIVGRGLFLTHSVFYHERTGQRLYQAVIYPYIVLIEVCLPHAVGIDAVRPSDVGIVGRNPFPVVHKVHRVARGVGDAVVFAEHQDAGQGESFFPGFIFLGVCSYLLQEIHVADTYPRMGGLQAGECLPVLVQRFLVYIPLELKARKDASVLRMAVMLGIREHPSYLRIRTKVIPLVVPAVSAPERIAADIDRTKLVIRAWNVAYQDIRLFDLLDSHVRFPWQANAYFPFVVGAVPENLLVADDGFLRQPVKGESVILFHHAQYDCTAVGVGESRIALPKAAGESSACRFELDFRTFALTYQCLNPALYLCCMFCHDDVGV